MRSQRTPGMVSTRQRRGSLRLVEARDVGDRALERGDLRRASSAARRAAKFRRLTRSSSSAAPSKRSRVFAHRRVAFGAHRRDDLARALAECLGARSAPGARAPRAASSGRRVCPVDDAASSGQHLLDGQHQQRRSRRPSSGSRAFPRTRSRGTRRGSRPCRCEPSSGMMVGDSLPGSSRRISGSAERGACSMMYLLSRTCCTPSMRMQQAVDPFVLCSAAAPPACGSAPPGSRSTVSTSRR